MVQHILDVDAAARAAALEHAGEEPVLLAFDTAAAFPTLARQAIVVTLRDHALPNKLRTFIRATFAGGRIAMAGATRDEAKFRARAGVPQGWPLSFPLVILTTLPLLSLLESRTATSSFGRAPLQGHCKVWLQAGTDLPLPLPRRRGLAFFGASKRSPPPNRWLHKHRCCRGASAFLRFGGGVLLRLPSVRLVVY